MCLHKIWDVFKKHLWATAIKESLIFLSRLMNSNLELVGYCSSVGWWRNFSAGQFWSLHRHCLRLDLLTLLTPTSIAISLAITDVFTHHRPLQSPNSKSESLYRIILHSLNLWFWRFQRFCPIFYLFRLQVSKILSTMDYQLANNTNCFGGEF